MTLIDRIDDARRRWNVLDHPFYVRWERGELTQPELARYAAEYRHAVTALADTAAAAAPLAGETHAGEEAAHVELWDDFARAVGSDLGAEPLPETQACASAWRAADPLEAVAVLYAVEAGQPAVSQTKLAGLVDHYGFRAGDPGTAYFSVHAELDHEHAEQARSVLEQRAAPADEHRLVAAAEAALAGNYALLDGVART